MSKMDEDFETNDIVDEDEDEELILDKLDDDLEEDFFEKDENSSENENEEDDDDNLIDETDTTNLLDLITNTKYQNPINFIEIPFDPKKHIQYLTLNEFTKIYNNLDEIINLGNMTVPKNISKDEFILRIISNNELNIKIKRPVDVDKYVLINLSQLKFDENRYRRKLQLLSN